MANTVAGAPAAYPFQHKIAAGTLRRITGRKAMTTRLTAKFAGLSFSVGVSMLAAAAAASAEQGAAPAAPQIEYGASLLCQTPQQAQQLVASLDRDMGVALRKVNAGVQIPACQAVPVAYVRGQALATLRSKDATFQMVQVVVVGVGNPGEFRAVTPEAFVALISIKEYAV
jgi:hypothetical protein